MFICLLGVEPLSGPGGDSLSYSIRGAAFHTKVNHPSALNCSLCHFPVAVPHAPSDPFALLVFISSGRAGNLCASSLRWLPYHSFVS